MHSLNKNRIIMIVNVKLSIALAVDVASLLFWGTIMLPMPWTKSNPALILIENLLIIEFHAQSVDCTNSKTKPRAY